MLVFESLRRNIYWGIDYVTRGGVRDHLRDLSAFYDQGGDDNGLMKYRLRNLLKHTVETVPFYQSFDEQSPLYEFPVVSKQTIKKRLDDFFSRKYALRSLYPKKTSGSYGTPFTFYFTREKKARATAEVIYYNQCTGFEIGMRHMHIAIRSKSLLAQIPQNQIVINPKKMNDEWIANMWRAVTRKQIKVIVGYTSSLMYIAEWHREHNTLIDKYPKMIITIAEPLGYEKRKFLQETFHCPVISRYASTEAGIIAQEKSDDPRFFVNNASLILEVVSLKDNTRVAPGEPGRLLITDLFSYAMPLIRYDIGDVVTISDDALNEHGIRILDTVEGRSVEIITDSHGKRISPIAIDDVFDDLGDIIRFQFVQKNTGCYFVRLVSTPSEQRENNIRKKLSALLGRDISVTFEYLDEIPPLPSGKRPYVVNEMAVS
jgi:phenylacetate-CoA ligase